jgi:putative FmdB family regulatory protein
MPLYEYECGACGLRFEIIQKFSDEPVTVCNKCGKGPVHKLLSAPAIQFKGSGWYITDYARKGDSAFNPSSTASGSSDKPGASDKPGSSDKSGTSDKAGASGSSGSSDSSSSSSPSSSGDSKPSKSADSN